MAKKRETEKESSSGKRNRKHKRNKPNKDVPQKHNDATPTNQTLVEPYDAVEMDQQCETPVVEHEEEIVCDGEVEIQMSDDGECVDVEEEPDTQSVPSTLTPTKAASNKKTDSSEKCKNKFNTTPPTTSKAAAAAAASLLNTSNSSAMGATGNSSIIGKKRKGRRDSGTSSDEERWLTAIESGKLEDVDDELKKIKDPKLMTARQRAMYERNLDKEPGGELLMSLPTGYREKEKPQTAEDIQKAALKSQKRKQMADEKREKDKKKTMERLLKKQETKQRSATRNKMTKTSQPMISYKHTIHGATISMPPDYKFPLMAQVARDPPKPQLCGISGCSNIKVYNCSKTKLPLCSFACYRKNVQAIKQIMC